MTTPGNIPVIVTQVLQALQQAQSQPLPPPATLSPQFRAFTDILGWGPRDRAPLSGDGLPVVDSWKVSAAGTQRIGIHEGNGQIASAGSAVPTAPAVRVTDGLGRPVSGVNVDFTVTSGGGSVGKPQATTDGDGVATAGSWTLGAGANTLKLTTPSGAVVDKLFTALGV